MRSRPLTTIFFCVFLFSLNPTVHAQEEQKEWEFIFAPYGWFAGLDGDLTVGDRNVDLDVGFSDIWDSLDFGGFGHLEARKGSWGGLLDVMYVKLSNDEDVTTEQAALAVELDTKEWITEIGGFYRLWRNQSRAASLDVLAGGRYWSLENELDLRLALPAGQVAVRREDDSDWLDPFVGIRFKTKLSERFLLNARADVGGFGIGSASDLSWNLIGLLGYELTPSTAVWAGYKALWLDRDKADLTMHGPVAGVSFVF